MVKKKVNLITFLIALSVFAALLVIPLFGDIKARQVFALLVFVAILWITEAIPLAATGFLIPVAAILMGLTSPAKGFLEFTNPIIFLFMGGFVLAGALSRYALDKMLARKITGLAKGNFYWSSVLLMLATSLTACWIGNTSSTAMMLPLGLGMLSLSNRINFSAESRFLMLGIAYAANIGGVITMVSTPPNAIGASLLGISFLGWMKYSIPVFLVTFPAMVIVLTLYFKPDRKISIAVLKSPTSFSGPAKILIAIFLFTVVLWMMEGVLAPLLHMDNGFNALVSGIAILMIFSFRILTLQEIIHSIRWEILLLFGGGLTLGKLIDQSDLGVILVNSISRMINTVPFFIFLWLIIIFSIIFTEFMSNTASAAMTLPLLFALATELHIQPVILVLPATIAASYGFMLPAGTLPNAMVFSSGLVPQKDMLKVGLTINILFSIILASFFYLVLAS
ncbi:MAG: DASS family sodium-coupled anion symporter [Ferruginibacter sp.]